MDGGDDRRITINFSSDGVVKFGETVKEKLKGFLGDYTDDILVEYVIVLLKNGRCKEEAKNELDVFLGDDSDSFITWLWDHLGSSLHLYSQSPSIQSDDVGSVEPDVQEPVGNMESESEEGRSKKLCKPRHRRQWKGLVEDEEKHQILKSSIVQYDPLKEDGHEKVNGMKPRDSLRKRSRTVARDSDMVLSTSVASASNKEDRLQRASISAPRRLLQFAVRDALASSRASISVTAPSLKRLRSVVYEASKDTTHDEHLDSGRPVTRAPNDMYCFKDVAEAEEYVRRVGSMSNVFHSLGYASDVCDISEQLTYFVEDFPEDRYVQPDDKLNLHYSHHSDFEEQYVSDMTLLPRDTEIVHESGFEYEGYNDLEEFPEDRYVQPHDKINGHSSYYNDFEEQYVSDMTLLQRDTEMVPESGFEYNGYNDMEDFPEDRYVQLHDKINVHSSYHNDFKEQYVSDMSLLPRGTKMVPASGFEYDGYNDTEIRGRKKAEHSLMLTYDVANDTDEISQKAFSSLSVKDASPKIVTRKSPQYREARENVKLNSNKPKAETEALAVKLIVPLAEANRQSTTLVNENVKSEAGISKESHKMQSLTHDPYSTGPLTDDADSRTIFVGNVHFAATKDGLSRHFNKFGEVVKVNILSDPATGLPKGSAYVEFIREEAAEHALSLEGTSFMSRILKVVRRSAAPPEGSSTSGWPRAAKPGSYPISGFSRTPFSRGASNVYRNRPLKPGAKSFQWKRDTQSIQNPISNQGSNTLRPVSRGLTYVRADL